ncbi:MAG: ABC transporter transmembrane domain-containing protein, partial [Nocardioidaceae bacterium]
MPDGHGTDREAAAPAEPLPPPRVNPGTPGAGWIRRLWGCMLRHRRDVVLSLGAALLGGACQTGVPLIARQIVDGVIVKHTSPLWPWLTLLIVVALASFGFAYIRRYRGGRVALGVQYDLRNLMHDHLQSMDLGNLSRMPTGQLVARANSDSTLVQGLLSFFPIMSGNVLLMILSLVVMIYLSPLLAVVSVVLAPTLIVVSYRMRSRVFPASWDAQQREGDMAQIVDEDVSGVRIVKAFGQEERELHRMVSSVRRLYGSKMRAVRLQARFQPLMETIPVLGQVSILALGGWMALQGSISLGTFLAFSTYVAQFVAPARQLAGILTIGQQARAGVERIFQLLDLEPTISDASGAVDLPAVSGAIEFRDVYFAYDDGPTVLAGLDLRIEPGERIAFVGPSGSGKSTAMMLVSRFHDPTSGQILVDGHDVRDLTLRSLRQQVAYAFEESFLFSDTVLTNIAYGHPDATREEVERAARLAQAHEFVAQLPEGYDTPIGERGLTLSGGQRQRVALARAILADPRIMILDDATSAVDAQTEETIHDGLRSVMEGRTTILVAHRRSTLHLADRIVVLANGAVADQGTHEQLMGRSALYRSLLSGLDEGEASGVGDGIEGLATIAAELDANGTTAAAWRPLADGARRSAQARSLSAPGLGPGLGSAGGGGWRLNLAPTPELLAKVEALPPVRDHPDVDLATESRRDPKFHLLGLLGEFRRPLLLGLLLVVLDALASLAGPILVKTGIDDGVAVGSQSVLFAASGVYLLITVLSLFNEIAETFVTGRTAERIMLSLRIRIWAQLQRLSLDYYEREMAGRIMTRMTTDVDSFESLVENGLLSALVSIVTFLGVGVLLLTIDLYLGLATLSVIVPLAFATVAFRRRAARLYDVARERIAIVNA